MNRTRILCALAALLAASLACLSSTPPPDTGTKPIGSIRQLKGGVRAGPESALQDVSPGRDMYDNEAAQVYNQGKAKLDYGYGISFTLYNDTSMGGTSVSASGQAKTKLAQGGLLGHNAAGSRTEVQLPNGGSVVILGTTYFVLYEAGSGVAWAYNFEGTLRYSVAGGGLQDLPQGSLVTFDRTQVLEVLPDLHFGPEEFDDLATDHDSPFAAMDEMLKDRRAGAPPPQPPPDVQNPRASLEGTLILSVECRYGPGDPYLHMYVFKEGEGVQVIGREAGARWLQVQTDREGCWINTGLVRLEGDPMRLRDTYAFPGALPLSPLAGKIAVVEVGREGQVVFVRWEGYEIPRDLRQEGLAQYIVEVWTCVDGQPGFYALGTDDTAAKFEIDESCGAPSHADVIGQDREGFSPPAEIRLP